MNSESSLQTLFSSQNVEILLALGKRVFRRLLWVAIFKLSFSRNSDRYTVASSLERHSAAEEVCTCLPWTRTASLESKERNEDPSESFLDHYFLEPPCLCSNYFIGLDFKLLFPLVKWSHVGDACERTAAMFVFQMLYSAKVQTNGRRQLVELLPIIWENRMASWF